ncbi:MAG: hypothetical protein IPG92_01005 [Flavobacteriales bacterium]|nr:hypothetical protein [Flavobacteriales bacterium]
MSPGVYTYTINGVTPCADASASLTITVHQAPNAGVGGLLELCAGTPPVTLINALTGGPALNGSWTGPDGPFVGIFQPGQSAEGTYVYTVPGTGACTDASASLEVNVMDLVLSGIDGPTWVDSVETLVYTALPALADADSIVWSLPPGWSWNDPEPTDSTAYVLPPAEAGAGSICAQAYGGGCDGDVVCIFVDVTVGMEDQADDRLGLVVYPNPRTAVSTCSLQDLRSSRKCKC